MNKATKNFLLYIACIAAVIILLQICNNLSVIFDFLGEAVSHTAKWGGNAAMWGLNQLSKIVEWFIGK